MKHGRIADFFFVGLGVTPVALILSGLPELVILLFVPLMFVACAFGMAEQLEDKERRDGDTAVAGRESSPRAARRLTFKQRDHAEKRK